MLRRFGETGRKTTMKTIAFTTVFAVMLAFAAGAAQFSLEGRWLENGLVQSNVTTTCAVSFYSAENASTAVSARNGVQLKTDSEGYFVIFCDIPSDLPDVFWAGITPQGKAQILPRTKVAPVPFTLSAVKAELVSDENQLELSGTALIQKLETSGNVSAEEWNLPVGGNVDVKNFKTSNVYVDSMRLNDKTMLGMFNAGADNKLTPDFSQMSFDKQVTATVTTSKGGFMNFYTYYHDRSETHSFVADKDGFVLLGISSSPRDCPYNKLSFSSGSVTLIDGLEFGKDLGSVQRLITVPCRKGESFKVELLAKSTEDRTDWWKENSNRIGSISVKIKFVYFGL